MIDDAVARHDGRSIPRLRATRTTCPYCGVGCGVLATPDGNGGAAIAGDPEHPANFGRLCSKGSALGETARARRPAALSDDPLHKGVMERVAWSDALDHVAHRFAAHHRARRPGRGRVLSLGPDADRGLLRRQQADEGIHRQRQCRHQFAALHGVVGRGPSPRLRRRHRARLLRGSRRGRSAGAGRLQRGVVPSGAVPAHARQQAEARRAHRGDRSAPDRYRRGCRPVSGLEARHRHRAVLGPAGASRRQRRARPRLHRTSHRAVSTTRWRGRAASPAASPRPRWRPGLPSRTSPTSSRCSRKTPRVVTLYSQGVNQSAQGTDKVNAILNCHLATGRIGKPGASPFSLTGQPNAMGGREVGGLANQLAAHMGFTPPDIDRVRRFWKAPRIATHEGLKAVQMFEAIGRGEIKALVGDRHQSGGVAAGRRCRARRAEEARTVRGLGECAFQRHRRCRRACAAAGAGLGREIRHGDQFGAAHLAAARVPDARRARPSRIGGSSARSQNGSASARRSISIRRRMCSASTRRCRRSRTTAAAISISARCTSLSDDAFDAMAPVQWPLREGDASRRQRFFAEGGFFTNDRKARFVAPEIPALRSETSAGAAAAAEHRPHPRPVAHHDPHRHQPAAGPASAGAVRRDSSRRRGAGSASTDDGFARVTTDYGQCIAQGRGQRAAAARHAVRADPLERGQRVRRARRRAGGALHRSVFRPAREQGDAGVDRALRICLPRLCAVAHATAIAAEPAGGRASPVAGGYGYLFADNADLARWQSWLRSVAGERSRRISRISAAAFTARPRLPASASRPACSSARRTMPATGTWSRACSPPNALSDDQRRMLLSGKSAEGLASAGPIVCACFGVGRNTICDAIAAGAQLGRRDRRAAEGRHQLRLVHSGNEAADRAGETRSRRQH